MIKKSYGSIFKIPFWIYSLWFGKDYDLNMFPVWIFWFWFCFLFSAGYFPSHKVFTVATIKSALEIGENTNVGNLLHVGLGIFAVKFDIIANRTFQANFNLKAKVNIYIQFAQCLYQDTKILIYNPNLLTLLIHTTKIYLLLELVVMVLNPE